MRRLLRNLSLSALLLLFSFNNAAITLVSTEYPTFVDKRQQASRYQAIVEQAFAQMQQDVDVQIMRQAFVGSALRSERADGELLFLGLNEADQRMHYSSAYMPIWLHLADRDEDVRSVSAFTHIEGARVATENRFANTDQLRNTDVIKWVRNPSAYDMFKQIAGKRADYLLADKLLLLEFNRLLSQSKRPALEMSSTPVATSGVHISLRKTLDGATELLETFDTTIAGMQADGSYNQLLQLPWLRRDVNADGVADYISSKQVLHAEISEQALTQAVPLDANQPGADALYLIDGQQFDNWNDAANALKEAELGTRASLMDAARYSRMMASW